MLGAYDKLIDARQVAAVLRRTGVDVDVDWVRAELNHLADERPPRLVRGVRRETHGGANEILLYFVLPPAAGADAP